MTTAWVQLDDDDRQSLTRSATARLLAKGLLLDEPGRGDAEYPLSPELGIILAARGQPAYMVLAQRQDSPLPGLSLFALGDSDRPVQAIVAEILVKAPPAGAGPLRCIYGYQLVSTVSAASLLAEWTIGKAEKASRWSREPARLVTRYFPADHRDRIGQRITVRGEGNTARVTGLYHSATCLRNAYTAAASWKTPWSASSPGTCRGERVRTRLAAMRNPVARSPAPCWAGAWRLLRPRNSACLLLGVVTVSPDWLIVMGGLWLFFPFLVAVRFLYRNWPTGISLMTRESPSARSARAGPRPVSRPCTTRAGACTPARGPRPATPESSPIPANSGR